MIPSSQLDPLLYPGNRKIQLCKGRSLDTKAPNPKMALVIEPFYGGSHKQLIDKLQELQIVQLLTLPPKKWHWRARTSALYFSQRVPKNQEYRSLFASCVLNLAELIALRPDLSNLHKILYFHENQLVYPIQEQKERDFQYGYNQILSCLVADEIVFNSKYNMNSFLKSIPHFLNIMPDSRPKNIVAQIEPKCHVLYFPLDILLPNESVSKPDELHILWPHRWEHDKNPELFFKTLYRLKNENFNFKLSVLGQTFKDVPKIFTDAKEILERNIINWGFQESKEDYINILCSADVVVSTANHEFFGVAMLEAVMSGCYALCPKKLVYPEIFPGDFLYNTENQLYKKLKSFCQNVSLLRSNKIKVDVDFSKYSWTTLKPKYEKLLNRNS